MRQVKEEQDLGPLRRLLQWYGRRFPIERGKGRLVKWAFRQLAPMETPVFGRIPGGALMELWPWIWSDFCVLMMGSPERYQMLYLDGRLTEETVFFDVGAYLAGYAFLAAGRADHGSAHIFEPHPESARRIMEAIARSRRDNMRLNQTAVGQRVGKLAFSLQEYPAMSGLQPAGKGTTEVVEVSVTTLDAYCREANIQRLDFLKIDVEGAEMLVLRGGREAIGRFRPEMIIELHGPQSPAFGYDVRALIDLLQDDLEYDLLRVEPGLTGPRLSRFRYAPDLERRRLVIIARPRKKA